jgi:hypothetical protein
MAFAQLAVLRLERKLVAFPRITVCRVAVLSELFVYLSRIHSFVFNAILGAFLMYAYLPSKLGRFEAAKATYRDRL